MQQPLKLSTHYHFPLIIILASSLLDYHSYNLFYYMTKRSVSIMDHPDWLLSGRLLQCVAIKTFTRLLVNHIYLNDNRKEKLQRLDCPYGRHAKKETLGNKKSLAVYTAFGAVQQNPLVYSTAKSNISEDPLSERNRFLSDKGPSLEPLQFAFYIGSIGTFYIYICTLCCSLKWLLLHLKYQEGTGSVYR